MGAAERLALSAAQYGIWLGQQLDPDSPAYWTAEAVELAGALDVGVFESALRQAIAECDALHTRFSSDGERTWQHVERRDDWPLKHLHMDHDAAFAWMQTDLQRPADLAHGPLFASTLLHTGPARALWYLRVHHVALDGFGYALLAQRVAALYSAKVAGVDSPAPRSTLIAPVVEEDEAYRASPAYRKDLDFWRARMSNRPAPALLAPPAPAGHDVLRRRATLPAAQFERWQSVARTAGTAWSAVMIAAFAAWLQRQTGARDVTIGLPVMGRLGSVALGVPCMAMNIIALGLQVDPAQSLVDLARQAAAELRSVRPHQRFRYEHLKQALGIAGGQRRLFGAVINLMPFDRPLAFGPLTAISHPVSAGPVEDLSLTIAPKPDGVRFDFEANPAAYSAAALTALHTGLQAALHAMLANPEQALAGVLGLRASAVLSGPSLENKPEPVLAALMRHARDTPLRVALEADEVRLDYATLLDEVQALAGYLRAQGVDAESRVALMLPREPRTIVALLAILWAGGAYLPLDPDGPALRIASVLEDAAPAMILTLRKYAGLASGNVHCLDELPDAAARPMPLPSPAGELAYIIYTSGSTGRPNGVMIDRTALAHFVAAASKRYQIRAADRVLQFAPLHFDASVEEIFLPLCTGATLVLRNDAMLESMPQFLDACAERRITVLDLPTAFWHELAYSVGAGQATLPQDIRLVIIGGEAAMPARVAGWRSHAVLLNTYGPTEATVICTTAALAGPGALALGDGALPIGTPLPGVDIAVVDAALKPVAEGVEGELCLIGPTLARGYLGRPELTAQRFVQLASLPGAPRAYRTGDRVVLGADGQLRYLGRLDDELKISGQRIDPLEIEAALLQYPGVREAAVVADENKRLTAFIVAGETPPAAAAMRSFLAERIAAAAIPSFYQAHASLPRNRNGKIDRKALRELTGGAEPSIVEATPLETTVMTVWREVLGVDALTPSDDFFALGGKSLQAIQVANRLGIALDREVPVSALFRHPTVAALAQSLSALSGHAPPPAARGSELAPLLTIQSGHGAALFCIHPAEGLAWCYLGLARHLPDMPIIGVQARGLTAALPENVDAMVDDYLDLIRATQPQGPYHLLGWSSGGGLAHAIAVKLQQAGEQVALLALMDAYPSIIWEGKPEPQEHDAIVALLDVIGADAIGDDGSPLEHEALLAKFRQPGSTLGSASETELERMIATSLHTMRVYRQLRHHLFDGDLLFFFATERPDDAPCHTSWQAYVSGAIEKIDIACNHNTMSRPAPLSHIGRILAQKLAHTGNAS